MHASTATRIERSPLVANRCMPRCGGEAVHVHGACACAYLRVGAVSARDGEVLRLRRRPDRRVQIHLHAAHPTTTATTTVATVTTITIAVDTIAAAAAADADAAVDAAAAHEARRLRVQQLAQSVQQHAPARI